MTFTNLNNRRNFLLSALATGAAASLLPFNATAENKSKSKGRVLVAGATGSIGRRVSRLLFDDGYEIKAITRDPKKAVQQYGQDYQWVAGDVRDPEAMEKLAEDVDFVVCMIGYTEFEGPNGPQFVDYMGVRNLVDAAAKHKIKHFVLLSSGNIGPYRDHTQNPRFGYVAYWKNKGEEWLKKSGVPFSIVGPSGFTDGPPAELGLRLAPRSEFAMTLIRRDDIARVVAYMVNRPDAMGKAVFIDNHTGSDTTSWKQTLKKVKPE
jgi:uncharacterized protein YbjT (DUF2867 family)